MRLLLDRHVFLWLVTDDRKAKKAIRAQIEAANEVYISAASVWEVANKTHSANSTATQNRFSKPSTLSASAN